MVKLPINVKTLIHLLIMNGRLDIDINEKIGLKQGQGHKVTRSKIKVKVKVKHAVIRKRCFGYKS